MSGACVIFESRMHFPLLSTRKPGRHSLHMSPLSHNLQPGGHELHPVADGKYPSLHKVQFCVFGSREKPALHIHLFCSSHIPLTQSHSKIYK